LEAGREFGPGHPDAVILDDNRGEAVGTFSRKRNFDLRRLRLKGVVDEFRDRRGQAEVARLADGPDEVGRVH
jgi:hypothetical protein